MGLAVGSSAQDTLEAILMGLEPRLRKELTVILRRQDRLVEICPYLPARWHSVMSDQRASERKKERAE